MSPTRHRFPVLRWLSVVWMIVWFPAYFHYWGWANLLHLCDVAVILSFLGIWFANSLLLSSQAVSCLVAGVLWVANIAARLVTGHFLVSGSEYMWDGRFPLWLRLLSTFHAVLPLLLLYTLRKVGYDRRGFALQCTIAALLLIFSRLLPADRNMNYAYRDPVWQRAWGPAPLHVALTLLVIVIVIYLPVHALLRKLFFVPAALSPGAKPKTSYDRVGIALLTVTLPFAGRLEAQLPPASTDEAISQLASSIALPLEKSRVRKVMVADLTGPQGQPHAVGRWLADQVSVFLGTDFPKLRMISRPPAPRLFSSAEAAAEASASHDLAEARVLRYCR